MPQDFSQLRKEGQKLNADLKAGKKRLDEITAELLQGDTGKFPECTVVGESSQVMVPEGDDDERVKELAGEHYGKLFEKVTSWKCIKGFADVRQRFVQRPDFRGDIEALHEGQGRFCEMELTPS